MTDNDDNDNDGLKSEANRFVLFPPRSVLPMFGPPFLVLPQKLVVARRAQNKFARKTSFDVFAAHQSRIQTLLNLVVGTMGFGRPVHVGSPDQLTLAVGAHLRFVLVVQCGFLEVPLPSRLE